MDFGDKIKQLRMKVSLTQEELAARCDLSKGFISQVERDLASPSIATLADMLDCLGSTLHEFFAEPKNEKIVFGKEDIFAKDDEAGKNSISWLIPNAQKNEMEPILITISPGGKSAEYAPFSGEVFGYVLTGLVSLTIGKNRFKAKKGESFYFKANAEYQLENSAKTEAKVVWVSSPPNF